MSSGIFVKFSTFNGGSVNASYRDQFEAVRLSWGVDVPVDSAGGGGLSVGRATPRAFELKFGYQIGMSDIALRSVKGSSVPTINIELINPNGNLPPRKLVRYDLSNTYITSVGHVDDTGLGDDLFTVTLAPAKVVMSQFVYSAAGALTSTKTATFDFSNNIFS